MLQCICMPVIFTVAMNKSLRLWWFSLADQLMTKQCLGYTQYGNARSRARPWLCLVANHECNVLYLTIWINTTHTYTHAVNSWQGNKTRCQRQTWVVPVSRFLWVLNLPPMDLDRVSDKWLIPKSVTEKFCYRWLGLDEALCSVCLVDSMYRYRI